MGPLAAAALAAVLAAAPADPAAAPPPLALTVSGAVSLGSYEAGLLHYLVESLRLAPGARELRLVTGASAGSANGLLAVLQHCGEAPASPQESLFWRSWIDVGLEDFHLPYEATPVAAFSRRALYRQAERIEEAWRRGLRASCDVVVGISATRVAPRLVALAPERLLLPRIDEQFTLRVQGRGPGRPPRVTNYVDPAWGGEQLLLPEDDDGEVPFLALRDLLLASVAFPAAFPPQPLAHCVARGGAPARCPASAAGSDLFLDGGLLDNTPLRSAVRLARAGLQADGAGGAAWAAAPRLGAGALPEGLLFAYVSPAVIGYPAEDEPPRSDQPAMIEHVTRVASSFVEAAFAKNLLVLVEDDPAIGARVAVPVRSLPAAGSPLAAFFGFFEEEFRAFDFQLGMYEARRLLAAGAGRFTPRAYPEDAGPEAAWRPLRCLRAVLDGAGDPAAACAGDELADFRILLQASLERLWDRCAPDNGGDPGAGQPLCRAAWGRAPIPAVPGVRRLPDSPRQRRSESHVAYVLRLLVGHGFWFRDHGLSRERTREAPAVLRRELVAIGRTVSAQQPLADGVILDALAAMAADAIVYVPPRNSVWVVLGRDVELGATHGFFDAFEEGRWFRLHAAAQLNQLGQAISSDPGPWAVTLLGGAELLPPRISSTRYQLGALLRGGWQLSSRDRFGKVACPVPDTDTIGVCSRPVLQAGAVGALLERVRLHVVAAWYPRYDSMRRALWAVSPAAGIEWAF